MNEKEIEPSSSGVDASDSNHPAAAPAASTPSWFNARPIPVFIIASWCILQFLGIVIFMASYWEDATEPVRTGAESSIGFVVKLLYPMILFWAGVLLPFMRKLATLAFGIYLAWGCFRLVTQHIDFPKNLSQ